MISHERCVACGACTHLNSCRYTSHHDPGHCFAETRDGTVKVTVYGDWLPRHVFGYLHAVFAYLRMIYLAIAVLLCTSRPSLFICDQVPSPHWPQPVTSFEPVSNLLGTAPFHQMRSEALCRALMWLCMLAHPCLPRWGGCMCGVVRALLAGLGLHPCAATRVPQGDLLLSLPGPASLKENVPTERHVR